MNNKAQFCRQNRMESGNTNWGAPSNVLSMCPKLSEKWHVNFISVLYTLIKETGADIWRQRFHSVYENIRLRPSTRRRIDGVFKFIHFGERFRIYSFTVSVFIVFVWTEGLNAQKSLRLLAFAFTIVFVWMGPKSLNGRNLSKWTLIIFVVNNEFDRKRCCKFNVNYITLVFNQAQIHVNQNSPCIRT